jgi:hypothetical protein
MTFAPDIEAVQLNKEVPTDPLQAQHRALSAIDRLASSLGVVNTALLCNATKLPSLRTLQNLPSISLIWQPHF